jgi:hypothetical protein
MASPKNSERRKRKYANQATRTARNKAAKTARHELRLERFKERANSLVGKAVKFHVTEGDGKHIDMPLPESHKLEGTVQQVMERPKDAKRRGNYLLIRSGGKNYIKARSRVKPV